MQIYNFQKNLTNKRKPWTFYNIYSIFCHYVLIRMIHGIIQNQCNLSVSVFCLACWFSHTVKDVFFLIDLTCQKIAQFVVQIVPQQSKVFSKHTWDSKTLPVVLQNMYIQSEQSIAQQCKQHNLVHIGRPSAPLALCHTSRRKYFYFVSGSSIKYCRSFLQNIAIHEYINILSNEKGPKL